MKTRGLGAPSSFNFSNQFKHITRVKLRVFVLKAATSGPHQTFYERNATTSAVFAIWHSARAQRSDSRTFFGLHLYLAGRCCKNPLSARGSAQCKPGPRITCFVRVTIYCTIFENDSTPPRQFCAQNTFKKMTT